MRFSEIKKFKIQDLSLDISNYRNKKDNIVSDGNRRVAALKVLYDFDYAPNDATATYAEELRNKYQIDFKSIQAQVSDNKKLISRTVYERHSGGKNGTSRIPWNAYAAARFGFDEKIGENREWRIMALLSKTEDTHPDITSFLDNEFSYEVFRRIIRSAFKLGVISENIFSERGESIKKTAPKNLVKDAIIKTYKFLIAMKKKRLSLSRKDGVYADSDEVNQFVSEFALSPDNQKIKDAQDNKDDDSDEDDNSDSNEDVNSDSDESDYDEDDESEDDPKKDKEWGSLFCSN